MAQLRETLQLTRVASTNAPESGGFPTQLVSIETDSSKRLVATQVVGTTQEAIARGDLSAEDALVYLRCLTEEAEVTYGVVVSGTYYPVGVLTPAIGYAKLGIGYDLDDLHLKSDTADTVVEVILHEITEDQAS